MPASLQRVISLLSVPLLLLNGLWFSIRTEEPLPLERVMLPARAETLRLTAHRGFSAVAPENTIPAIEAAADAGFFAAEFDIHETKDGHWIVNHDDTVDAMTDGTGKIKEMTLAELRALTVDAGANIEAHPGLGLPTLEEALDACLAGGIRAEIEIKAGSTDALTALAEALRVREMLGDSIIISFNHDILTQLYALEPEVEYWYLCGELSDETFERMALTPEFRVAFNGNAFDSGLIVNGPCRVHKFREAGYALAVWTIDHPVMLWLYALWGVEYVTTNRFMPMG